MALPTTLSDGDIWRDAESEEGVVFGGPFKSSGGNFYVVTRDVGNDSQIHVFKASDPTSSWSVQASHDMNTGESLQTAQVVQDGDNLHIFSNHDNEEYRYARFSMSSDGFTVSTEQFGGTAGQLKATGGGVENDGTVKAIWGSDQKIMGTNYDRVGLDRRLGTDNWTTDAELGSGENHRGVGGPAVMDASNHLHFGVVDQANDDLYIGTFTSADAGNLSSAVDTSVANIETVCGLGVAYEDGGTEKVRIPFEDSTGAVRIVAFDSAAVPSPSVSPASDASDNDVRSDTGDGRLRGAPSVTFVVNGTDQHLFYVDSPNQDVMHAEADGADSWGGTDTAVEAGTYNHVFATVYDRSGAKLAYVYQDSGGTVRYNEIDLAGATVVTRTLSLNAALQEQLAIAASLNAAIQKRLSRQASLDAALRRALTETTNLNAAIQVLRTATGSLDAALGDSSTVSADLSAGVAHSKFGATFLDAALALVASLETALDAAVLEKKGIQSALHAAVQDVKTAAAGLEAVIAQGQTSAANLNAVIQALRTAQASLDAAVEGRGIRSVSIDATVQRARIAITVLDAVLVVALAATTSLDATVQRRRTNSANLDAAMQTRETLDAALDAALRSTLTITTSLDAFIQAMATGETAALSLDAVLQAVRSLETSLSAAVMVVRQATLTLDAAVRRDGILSLSLSAGLADAHGLTQSLEAVLTKSQLLAVSLSAAIRARQLITLGFDAALGLPFSPRAPHRVPGRPRHDVAGRLPHDVTGDEAIGVGADGRVYVIPPRNTIH